MLTRPLVLGHEAAGIIADGPRQGERVAIDPAIPDNTCELCLRGYRNLCTGIVFAGHGGQDGAMREFLANNKKFVIDQTFNRFVIATAPDGFLKRVE